MELPPQNRQSVDSSNNGACPAIKPRPTALAVFPDAMALPKTLTEVDRNCSGGVYGLFDVEVLASQAAAFICSTSDGAHEDVISGLSKFLTIARDDCSAGAPTTGDFKTHATHSCWLCIRLTKPTDQWVVPRWHRDGIMFDCTCPEPKLPHSKYAVTLLGPPTRLAMPGPAVDAVLAGTSESGRRWDYNNPDAELAGRLSKYGNLSLDPGQVIRFSWGQADSPVHSEPDSSASHRVFVSILFGCEEEIRNMCERRQEKYGIWK